MIPSFVPAPAARSEDEGRLQESLARLEQEYSEARAAVVESALEHVAARERASDLRERYVVAHDALRKSGAEVPVRLLPGVLPGQTAENGLRARWLVALGRRW